MTIVVTETEEIITTESLDLCCSAFAAGDVSMRDACNLSTQISAEEFIWESN